MRVVRSAPLGDPIEIEVRCYRLSLRKAEASTILVETEQPPASSPGLPQNGRIPLARRRVTGPNVPLAAAERAPHYRVAIAGNPNTGKTTLFNALTGSTARVGNYPGITVDRLVGQLRLSDGHEVELIDIPGTYSLTARSREEQLALDEILGRTGEPPADALVVMLSATALARSLYLLVQVQEFGIPVIAAVNMMDEAASRGIHIDFEQLEQHFGVPFIPVIARTKRGLDDLRGKLELLLSGKIHQPTDHWLWKPDSFLDAALDRISNAMKQVGGVVRSEHHRRAFALWCLMSLRERDPFTGIPPKVRTETLNMQQVLRQEGCDADIQVAQARYDVIDSNVSSFVTLGSASTSPDMTSRIDAVLTHPVAGMLIFLSLMGLVFTALFDWAAPMMDGLGAIFAGTATWVARMLPDSIIGDLIANGLLRGVGSVVVFLPQIIILFLFLTLLEGTGYMSRAAFMMDRVMRKIGLQDKAIVPLVSGFACSIPAVMATRTLESRRDRVLAMMAIPLVSCSARLPIYTLIIGALFPAELRVLGPLSLGTLMMLTIYMLSMVMAMVAALILGRTVLRGRRPPLLLELPPYRLPSAQTVGLVLWQKARLFLRTAGTVIVVISLALWALLSFPRDLPATQHYERALSAARASGNAAEVSALRNQWQAWKLQQSYAGRLGKFIEPVIAPLGFDWKIGIGLVGSFAAREVFVTTMGLVYGVGRVDDGSSLTRAMQDQTRSDGSPVYTPLTGLSLLVFYMFAMQCMSTLAVVRQESGSWKWPLFMLGYLSTLAYLASLLTFQLGRLLGFE